MKLPIVFVQIALESQLLLPVLHSSISVELSFLIFSLLKLKNQNK